MKSYPSNAIDNLSTVQTLLVHACLATNAADREHYVRAWEATVLMEELDFSSYRLVPYFLHKNQQDGIACRYDKRLKVIYKHWWLRTRHIQNELRKVHGALLGAGIEVAVIKGAALQSHYAQPELRAMADFDLLVRRDDLHTAIDILGELGFVPKPVQMATLEAAPGLFMDFFHAISWTHRSHDTFIDLHWRVGSRCSEQFTEALWHNLVPCTAVAGGRKPALAFEVFMVLIHAMDSSSKDNLNWIIDIAVMGDRLDDRIWEEARQLAVWEKKADLFDYACSVLLQFGVAVPDPGHVRKPRRLSAEPMERGGILRELRNIPRRAGTLCYTVGRLFPHASALEKGRQLLRRVQLFWIARRVRRRITSPTAPRSPQSSHAGPLAK